MGSIGNIFKNFKGDKALWAVVALIGLFSFLPANSATTFLAFHKGNGNPVSYFARHGVFLLMGLGFVYAAHRIPTHYFRGISKVLLPFFIILLAYTLTVTTEIGEANANRWIKIAGFTFQTSTAAWMVLMMYIARYLSKIKDTEFTFNQTFIPLWLPILLVVGLVLPENFSTAAIIGVSAFVLCFVGGYPLKYLGVIFGAATIVATLFFSAVYFQPEKLPTSRAITWKNRIETFLHPEKASEDANRQMEYSKMAIARGQLFGVGAGKSLMKNILSQSSSDFIYAIIIEEYGLIGGLALLLLYLFFLFRVIVIANGNEHYFARLLVIAMALPIISQALINMAVVVGLFPVTGQPLPLISMGGTSIWVTCAAIGIIIGASIKDNEDIREEENPLNVVNG